MKDSDHLKLAVMAQPGGVSDEWCIVTARDNGDISLNAVVIAEKVHVRENADRIVQAFNAHAEMLAALYDAREWISQDDDGNPGQTPMLEAIDRAIARGEAQDKTT